MHLERDPVQLLDDAFDAAEEQVTEIHDAHDAFRLATRFASHYRKRQGDTARLRGIAAQRIRKQDALSLSGLAGKIGVSPQRAQQLLKEAGRE